jgi:hypothetical protein
MAPGRDCSKGPALRGPLEPKNLVCKGFCAGTGREAGIVKEFWSELITKASWEKLKEISREFDFILIGGWAAYLWTKTHKSKDIGIVIDYDTLGKISDKYTIMKNERLKKYEIKLENFDIDVYLPYFSELGLPVEELKKHISSIEGIKTVKPEILVILKQAVEIKRRNTPKGRKDLIDILTLLIYSPFDVEKYRKFLEYYKMEYLEPELKTEVQLFSEKDLDYIGMNRHSFAKWKKEFLGL